MIGIISDFIWGALLIALAIISFVYDEVGYGIGCLVLGVVLFYWFGWRGLQKRRAAKGKE